MRHHALAAALLFATVHCGVAQADAEAESGGPSSTVPAQIPAGGSQPGGGGATAPLAATAEPVAGGTRLKAIVHTGSDGSSLTEAETFFDDSLQMRCALRTASDGALRCLPALALPRQLLELYRDAACSVPVLSWPCALATPFYYTLVDSAVLCPDAGSPAYLSGGELSPSQLYAQAPASAGGACTPIAGTQTQLTGHFYAQGTVVAPGAFVLFP